MAGDALMELWSLMPNKRPKSRLHIKPTERGRRRGRPPLDSYDRLRDVWVFITALCRRHDMSVSAACKTARFVFFTIRSHKPYDRVLRGETLRRLYYEANGLLQEHIAEHNEMSALLKRCGATASGMTALCALEQHWNALAELECDFLEDLGQGISPQPRPLKM